MGDSITYANQAGKWARAGVGRTPDELALAKWMHAELNDRRNGWWLAANDQPDNGERVRRLGIGGSIPQARYNVRSATRELARILGDESCLSTASKVGETVRAEDGPGNACRAVEEALIRKIG